MTHYCKKKKKKKKKKKFYVCKLIVYKCFLGIENDTCVSKHVYRIKEGFKNYQDYE